MSAENLLSQLADIELPAPEPTSLEFTWLAAGVIVIAMCTYLIWHKYRNLNVHNQNTFVDKINLLEQQWQQGKTTPRQAAYQLTTLLRLGLGLTQLPPSCPEGITTSRSDWASTIQLLQKLRYAPNSGAQLNQETFHLIRTWLGKSRSVT